MTSAAAVLTVDPVRSGREREEFVALPYRLHRRDPMWVPVLRRDVRALLSREKNPFFEHAEADFFLARRRGKVVGRIAAIHNRLHNEFHGDRVGFFGFFEAVDDPEVAGALLETAAAWLRQRGLTSARGPTNFSTNDECGLLVDGFDTPPVIMMPHNPRYYVGLIEGAGYAKAKDLYAYRNTHNDFPERLGRGVAVLEKRYGLRTRPIDLRRYDAEVELIKRVYNASWERNWGFVPMTEAEMDYLARQLRPVVVADLVPVVECDGEAIGMGVALPDLNVAFKANPSGRLFPGIVKVLWASRRIGRIRVPLLGAVPEWRNRGIDAVLYKWIWEKGHARKYFWCEASWILEDNHAMRNGLERMGFAIYKTYRIYERSV